MTAGGDPLAGLDVEGPVQLEVFVLAMGTDGAVELTGPCGAEPWYLEAGGATEHPVDVVRRIVTDVIGAPLLVHSTSWRQGDDGVILSFLVVLSRELVGSMASAPVRRADLARSDASAAPASIGWTQVLEHALRHLAWLAGDDEIVAATLSDGWRAALASYAPEPFRNLG